MIRPKLPLSAALLALLSAQAGAQAIYQGPGSYSTQGNVTYGPGGSQLTFGNQIFTSSGTYSKQGNQTFGPNGNTLTTQPTMTLSSGPITSGAGMTSAPISGQAMTGKSMLGAAMTSPQSILTPSKSSQASSAAGQTYVAGPNGQSGSCSSSGSQTFCN